MPALRILLTSFFFSVYYLSAARTLTTACDTVSVPESSKETFLKAPLHAVEPGKAVMPKALTVSAEELRQIRRLFYQAMDDEQVDITTWAYRRQYYVYTDAAGKKKVYVNCFVASPGEYPHWKTREIRVDDSGKWYCRLLINLTDDNFKWLDFNGLR